MKKTKKLWCEMTKMERIKQSLEEDSMLFKFWKWLTKKNSSQCDDFIDKKNMRKQEGTLTNGFYKKDKDN